MGAEVIGVYIEDVSPKFSAPVACSGEGIDRIAKHYRGAKMIHHYHIRQD